MNIRGTIGLLLAAGLIAALGSACRGRVPAARPHAETVRLTSASGQAELLLVPPTVHGVVLFMHGLNSDQDELLDEAGLFPVRDALLAAHYAIAASESHGNNLGNPVSVADQVDLLTDVTSRLGAGWPVNILAFSMGGADALLSAAGGAILGLRAVALLSPLCDQLPYLQTDYRGDVQAAFGDSPDLSTVVARSDPMTLPAADYAGKTYEFWQSPADHIVPARQSGQMVAHLRGAGVVATLTPLTGNHGDLSQLNPADVVTLFDLVSQPTGIAAGPSTIEEK